MAPPSRPEVSRRTALAGVASVGALPASATLAPPRQVVVVGAGLAGLAAAWELDQAGYHVTVLEAQTRLGGRNWTLRGGDVVPDTLGQPQTCTFSAGQYLNAGPWRVMPFHTRMLDCAAQLGIALQALDPQDPAQGFQPIEGMDAFPLGLARALARPVQVDCVVLGARKRQTPAGVRAEVDYQQQGQLRRLHADAVVLCLPLNRLAALDLPLPAALLRELGSVDVADAIKIAWERNAAMPRGGYPSTDAGEPLRFIVSADARHRIVGVYGNSQILGSVMAGSREAQVLQAQALWERRSGAGANPAAPPIVVQWSRIPHHLGAACQLPRRALLTRAALMAGAPPFYFAGDALSSFNGWQEGALESGRAAARAVRLQI